MDNCMRNHLISSGILATFILIASPVDAAEPSVGKKLVVRPSASGAASAIQPNAEIRNSITIPAPTDAALEKKAMTPGAAQSLNPQPLPPGGGVIKQMPGASMQPLDMAKPHIDSGIKASPALSQPAAGIGGKTGAALGQETIPSVRPGMAALAPPVSPGHITGATVNVTSAGATIRIEGSGRCALNVIDMHHGGQGPAPIWPRRVDAPPSYIGPLPTRIEVQAKVVDRDFVKIEGAGGPKGCAGYASVSLY